MSESEQPSLRDLAGWKICPNCGKEIPKGGRFPFGEGVFCSLDCVAEYNAADLVERHKRRLAAEQRKKN